MLLHQARVTNIEIEHHKSLLEKEKNDVEQKLHDERISNARLKVSDIYLHFYVNW